MIKKKVGDNDTQELIPCYLPEHHLRSSIQSRLRIRSVKQGINKKHFGVGAFSNAAPQLWHSLPMALRQHHLKESFKKNLNTYWSWSIFQCCTTTVEQSAHCSETAPFEGKF